MKSYMTNNEYNWACDLNQITYALFASVEERGLNRILYSQFLMMLPIWALD